MRLSKIAIYLMILAALAAYVYLVEIRQKEKAVALKDKQERLVHMKKDNVTHVELNSKEHGKIILEKAAKNWVLTDPVKTKADDKAVQSLLLSIVDAKRDKDKRATVSFGKKNPVKTSYYVRVNHAPDLLLVADTLKNSLNKTSFYLRDKTVVAVAPEDVDRIVIKTKGKETELERQGPKKWRMTKPKEMKVKKSFVEADLRSLTNLEAKRIIDDPGKDVAAFGLESPEMTVLLAGKKLQQALVIGNPVKETVGTSSATPDRYARIKGRHTVYVIDARVMKNLEKDPEKIRDRSLLEYDQAAIERMDITLDGKKWVVSRGKDRRWSLEQPHNKKTIKTWPVTGILWDLKGLEWKSREKPSSSDLTSFHLKNPRLVVSLFKRGDKEPIVLKAGWPETQVKGAESGESAGAASGKKAHEEKTSKQETGKELANKAEGPKAVNVLVQPHPGKGTVFVVDGGFIKRLRGDLKEIVGEGK
ncbi:MAG: DUF4340 domain-containing protein [Deltaproteobacteria bacterium]